MTKTAPRTKKLHDTHPSGHGNALQKHRGTRRKQRKADATPSKAPIIEKPDAAPFRASTKGAAIVDLLKRKQGATINELMTATGWQAHSVRGFLSGTLKKKLGLAIASERSEGGQRRYRIES